jgi:hypothetical protein
MPANLKSLMLGFFLIVSLSGCGIIEAVETPSSWGESGGSYGAEEWVEKNGKGLLPTTDSAALFCVSIAESGQKKFNWNFQQTIEATDACTRAFVDGLK